MSGPRLVVLVPFRHFLETTFQITSRVKHSPRVESASSFPSIPIDSPSPLLHWESGHAGIDPLRARILPRESRHQRADTDLLRELVVDTSEMRELMQGYFGELDWSGGATKDALVAHLAGRDEALRTMVNEYVAEGTYQNLDDVMNVLPEQAWQSVQGDTWRGPESQYVEDVPSHFAEGPVGQDEGNV